MKDFQNIERHDVDALYKDVERRTNLKFRALKNSQDIDDSFVVTKEEYPLIHAFALEGASIIASESSYVKHHKQTGLEALTYQSEQEGIGNGEDVDEGEKLNDNNSDFIYFEIEGLPETGELRRTVVQEFIYGALIHYILYKWYILKGLPDAGHEFAEHHRLLSKVKSNAVRNMRKARRPYKYF
jgi:hypothetical protein